MATIIGYYGTAPTKEKFKALKDSFGDYGPICWKESEETIKQTLEKAYGDKLEKKDVILEFVPLSEKELTAKELNKLGEVVKDFKEVAKEVKDKK